MVECHIKYVGTASYGQHVEVTAHLQEYENRLKIAYEIRDAKTGERLTKGYTVQLAIEAATMELQFISPAIVFNNLEALCQQ